MEKFITMASLAEIYIKKEHIEALINIMEKEQAKGVSVTLAINDTANDFGQNVSAWLSQSKEQRETKEKKVYIGNGRVFWGDMAVPYKVNTEQNTEPIPHNDLPCPV